MATVEDLLYVRDYVGMDEPTDSEIYALVDETGSSAAAAQRILLRRKADLEAIVPFSVPGFTQGSPAASLAAIDKKLDVLEGITGVGGEGGVVTTSQLVRPDRCRR
jgi:hypothetical protein